MSGRNALFIAMSEREGALGCVSRMWKLTIEMDFKHYSAETKSLLDADMTTLHTHIVDIQCVAHNGPNPNKRIDESEQAGEGARKIGRMEKPE